MRLRTSDVKPLLRDFDTLIHAFDFTRQDLGIRAVSLTAQTILDAMDAECDPDGNSWPELSPRYETWKKTVAPGEPMAVLHGHMKQITELEGSAHITRRQVIHTYGTNPLTRMEAIKFQLGGLVTGTRQPPRPFFGFGHVARTLLANLFRTAFPRL